MDPLTLALISGGVGAVQSLGGAIQRSRAEKAARGLIAGKLGPDAGILGYYGQALQNFQALRSGESAMQKQYQLQAQRNLANTLRTLREAGGPGGVIAGGPNALRAANEAQMRAAATGEQLSQQALGRLGSAAQMAAAEKRRPAELELQMQLQKGAGGTQIANTGMSNIFNAIQAYMKLQGESNSPYPKDYIRGVNTGMLDLYPTPRTSTSNVSTGSRPRVSATPSAVRPR